MTEEKEADRALEPRSISALDGWTTEQYGRRKFRRWQINERAIVKIADAEQACLVRDISPGGTCIEFDGFNALIGNDRIFFELEGYDPIFSEVRSIVNGRLGIVFLHDVAGQEKLANWLTLLEFSRRRHKRKNIESRATLYIDQQQFECITQNVSLCGARILLNEIVSFPLGATISLEIEGLKPIPASIRRKIQDTIGVSFDHSPATQDALRDWLQRFPD